MAAAASTPICPMMAVYEAKPTPQNRDPPISGRHWRKKSFESCFSLCSSRFQAGRI